MVGLSEPVGFQVCLGIKQEIRAICKNFSLELLDNIVDIGLLARIVHRVEGFYDCEQLLHNAVLCLGCRRVGFLLACTEGPYLIEVFFNLLPYGLLYIYHVFCGL